jgi:hypothetical protein
MNIDASAHPITAAAVDGLRSKSASSVKPIREILVRGYARLDPAVYSPTDVTHPLRIIEDSFSQSIDLGSSTIPSPGLADSELLAINILKAAEAEWDLLGRDYSTAVATVCLLRKVASILVKRSIGIRLGHHAMEDWLRDFESSIRDVNRLGTIKAALQPLLGETGFRFNLIESFGQPQAESRSIISLESDRPGIRPYPAPDGSDAVPSHDVPCFEITGTNYRMPITFEFYLALRLRKDGCAGSSLPASVRAALDRVRHQHAGRLCRAEEAFVDGRATVVVGGDKRITVSAAGAAPTLNTD